MINLDQAFNKLLKDAIEASPDLGERLNEISPLSFLIDIKGFKKAFIRINQNTGSISFQESEYQFLIEASLLDIATVLVSKKIDKSLISKNSELAIVFFNIVFKSNIDLIYLIDKYFGSYAAFIGQVLNQTHKNKVIESESNIKYKLFRKRVRSLSIRIDRLEAFEKL